MNLDEELVHRHLQHLNIGPVAFEPDGNCPPDFLVDGRIAVEARRLNKNFGDPPRGLEHELFPLKRAVAKALKEAGPAQGSTWRVSYFFRRPLPEWSVVTSDLASMVREFLCQIQDPPRAIKRVWIELQFHASAAHSDLLIPTCFSDRDRNGWALPDLRDNLRLCIDEKTKKVEAFRHKYREWRLILVERVVGGDWLDEIDDLRSGLTSAGAFNRIRLINPDNAKLGVDVYPSPSAGPRRLGP